MNDIWYGRKYYVRNSHKCDSRTDAGRFGFKPRIKTVQDESESSFNSWGSRFTSGSGQKSIKVRHEIVISRRIKDDE